MFSLIYYYICGNGFYARYITRCITHLVIQRLEYDGVSHLYYIIKLSLSTHVSEFLVMSSIFLISEFTSPNF